MEACNERRGDRPLRLGETHRAGRPSASAGCSAAAELPRWGLVVWTAGNVHFYRHMSRVGGVVHTHSTYATAWAAWGEEIPCVLTM
jgi:hypothetical protein